MKEKLFYTRPCINVVMAEAEPLLTISASAPDFGWGNAKGNTDLGTQKVDHGIEISRPMSTTFSDETSVHGLGH